MENWRCGMNKFIAHFLSFFILLLCMSNSVLAQTQTILLHTKDSSYQKSSSMIILSGNGLWGSNALDNNFMQKSIYGGLLETSHLEKIIDKMKSQNRAGFLANSSIQLYNFSDTLLKKPEWGLRAEFSSNYHGFLSFNRDLFKTIYKGNKTFEGQTVQLGPVIGGYQSWQKFGVGLFNKSNWSSITVSLVAGQQYQSLISNSAKLFTSKGGDSLSLVYAGEYLRSDTLKKGFANGSGLGVALDFNYNLPLAENNGIISISLRDIGFIAWNKNSQQFRYDSTSYWTGIDVSQVFQFGTDSLNSINLKDSLHFEKKTKNFATALPASAHVRYSNNINERNLYEAGILIWPNRAAVPLIYAGASQFLRPDLLLSERMSFGGYGKLGVGVEMQWMPKSSWFVQIGTNNIEGFISKNTSALSGYFSLAKFFGRVSDDKIIID